MRLEIENLYKFKMSLVIQNYAQDIFFILNVNVENWRKILSQSKRSLVGVDQVHI